MKTLVISETHGIFCGTMGIAASFTKDEQLCGGAAYAFDTEESARNFVEKFPEKYKGEMQFKPIDYKSNYVPLDVLIKQGYKEHTGYMLDLMVSDRATKH